MPSSQLYRKGRRRFIKDAEARYEKIKDLELLREFLAQNARPEDAKAEAEALKKKTGEKWSSKKIGDVEIIPAAWIEKLMGNIGNFVEVGNYAMTGAPESVGLAWFAVKLTLSAIHGNYELYTFFGSALTDISEIMIIIPHYDGLYDERTKTNEWKPSPVVEKLFQDIIDAYSAVINFSFSVQRHLRAGSLAKIRHGIKDFFGTSKANFEGSMATIAAYKQKILEDSQAIFQDKSLHQIGAIKGIVSNLEGTVKEIKTFQETLRKMNEEQAARWALVLRSMDDIKEDIKETTKAKTPWDIAMDIFQKNKEMLNPQENISDALGDALDRRYPDTCQWIFQRPHYVEWHRSTKNGLLCINGQEGSGKTTVLATIVERMDLETIEDTILLYMNCGPSRRGAAAKKLSLETVCSTLMYLLYDRARHDKDNLKLLEECNKVFAIPEEQERARSTALVQRSRAERLPEFANAFLTLAAHLDVNIVVALDDADCLDANDQQALATKLNAILTLPRVPAMNTRTTKLLVGCRSVSKLYSQVQAMESLLWSVDVGKYNDNDMETTLKDALKNIPDLTEWERKEAVDAILTKARPRFAYISAIAIPFMREPFRRPLSGRLQGLPKGMDSVYHTAIQKMGSNYLELLRTALLWSLLAPVPLRLQELMDAYHGTYKERGLEVEKEAKALAEDSFPKTSILAIEQIQDARGPFLSLELEVKSDTYLVHLQDPPQVREFFFSADVAGPQGVSDSNPICTHCTPATTAFGTLRVSPKEDHLRLAIECMRAMNNAVFQRRSTRNDTIPLWNESALSDDNQDAEIGSQQHEGDIAEATIAAVEVYNQETELERMLFDRAPVRIWGHFEGIPEEDIVEIFDAEDVEQGMEEIYDEDNVEEETEEIYEIAYEITEPVIMKQLKAVDISQAPFGDTEEQSNHSTEDSDEYQDEEDRKDRDQAKVADRNDKKKKANDRDLRMYRYEMGFWSYHVLQAEALWSQSERLENSSWTELLEELEYWVNQNSAWFRRWQLWEPTLSKHQGHLEPLHVAAYLGLTSWVSHLLRNGAQIDTAPSEVAQTPLQVAADTINSLEMLQLLLESGADPNIAIDNSIPAFHKWLIKRSDLADIQLMLKHGADPTLANQVNSWTALHCFAWRGEDVNALDVLLNHAVNGVKPDINARDDEGNTPLHVLLWRRQVPKVLLQAFVSRGANVNEENNNSARPLQMACLYGDLDTLKVLCHSDVISEIDDEDNDGDTALQQAAIGNHTGLVKFLVEFGANPNVPNHSGKVALHNSALKGTRDCIEILLSNGASPNLFDNHNRTPLFCACLGAAATEDKAKILLDTLLGMNVPLSEINSPTTSQRTPLREAAAHGFKYVVAKLIDTAKARNDFDSLALNEPDTSKGMTPLHRAVWFGRTDCVSLLLAANADVKLCDKDGKTALTLAIEQWALASHDGAFENILSLLIDADPEAAAADPELVAVCAMNGSSRLLQKLVDIGADLNRQDRYGWTPIELARNYQQEEASRFLKKQAAWAGMLPSQWAKNPRTAIAGNGTTIEHTSGKRVCISTNTPLPAGLDSFYFEIIIYPALGVESNGSDVNYPVLAIGFCTIGGSAILFPGWPPHEAAPGARSWGYHGSDGCFFDSRTEDGDEVTTKIPYGAGNIVGCGVDLTTQTIWFTRNGQRLGSEFKNVQGRLFPLLGLKDAVIVETNFTGPFMWQEDDETGAVKTNK